MDMDGLEPSTSGLSDQYSNQLNYISKMESVGFDPTSRDFQSLAFTRLAYFPQKKNHSNEISQEQSLQKNYIKLIDLPNQLTGNKIRTTHIIKFITKEAIFIDRFNIIGFFFDFITKVEHDFISFLFLIEILFDFIFHY